MNEYCGVAVVRQDDSRDGKIWAFTGDRGDHESSDQSCSPSKDSLLFLSISRPPCPLTFRRLMMGTLYPSTFSTSGMVELFPTGIGGTIFYSSSPRDTRSEINFGPKICLVTSYMLNVSFVHL